MIRPLRVTARVGGNGRLPDASMGSSPLDPIGHEDSAAISLALRRRGQYQGTAGRDTDAGLMGRGVIRTPGDSRVRSAPINCRSSCPRLDSVAAFTAIRPTARQPGSLRLAARARRCSPSTGPRIPSRASATPEGVSSWPMGAWLGTTAGDKGLPRIHCIIRYSLRAVPARTVKRARLAWCRSSLPS